MENLTPALISKIEQLGKKQAVAFVLLLCERMSPALRAFSEETGFPDDEYQSCMRMGWTFLLDENVDREFELASQRCLALAPDTEDFSSELTTAALNATLSIGGLMEFITDADAEHVLEAASLCFDTIYIYVQQSSDAAGGYGSSDEDAKIRSHPLFKKEVERQWEDIELVAQPISGTTAEWVSQLKAKARQSDPIIPLARRS